jgi:hypothetical protein
VRRQAAVPGEPERFTLGVLRGHAPQGHRGLPHGTHMEGAAEVLQEVVGHCLAGGGDSEGQGVDATVPHLPSHPSLVFELG